MFYDYENVFEDVFELDSKVIITGYSRCSDEKLAGPVIWAAAINDGLISEWGVHEDTNEVRSELGIS